CRGLISAVLPLAANLQRCDAPLIQTASALTCLGASLGSSLPQSTGFIRKTGTAMIKIGVGSKTSTGGTVIEGNPGIMFDGLVASSVGHQASCPACRKGIG